MNKSRVLVLICILFSVCALLFVANIVDNRIDATEIRLAEQTQINNKIMLHAMFLQSNLMIALKKIKILEDINASVNKINTRPPLQDKNYPDKELKKLR